MNAEFLEKYIVVSSETTGEGAQAVTTYSVPKARKGMDSIAFLDAYVITEDKTEAYAVVSAVVSAVSDGTEVEIVAGPYTLTYTIATGEFEVAKK